MPRFDRVTGILGAALFALGISCSCTEARAQLELAPPSVVGKAGAPVRVTPQRDLTFGDVIPGVDSPVAPTDPTSGLWEIKATNDAIIDIDFFSLPPALNGTGDTMPVRFEPNQALVVIPQLGTSYVFDPVAGISVQIGTPGRAYVYLGGVASPRGNQSPGSYSSAVTLDSDHSSSPGRPVM